MPAYGPGAIINQGGRPTYGSAVANLLDAIQGRQNQQAAIDDQKKQQAQAAREARVQGVLDDLKKVPAYQVKDYIAQLPSDLQEDLRNHGRGLIAAPMSADDYQDKQRIHDFTELSKLDPTDPRVKASTEARTYAYLTKRDLPPEQWQTTMTGNLQGTPGLTEANRIANKQQVTANEAADNALAGRKFNEIDKPQSVATIGKTRAETGKLGAETATERMRPALVGAQTAEANAKAAKTTQEMAAKDAVASGGQYEKFYQQVLREGEPALSAIKNKAIHDAILNRLADEGLNVPRKASAEENKTDRIARTALDNVDRIETIVDKWQKRGVQITGPALGRLARAGGRVGTPLDKTRDFIEGISGGSPVPKQMQAEWNHDAQQILNFEKYLAFQEVAATVGGRPAAQVIESFERVAPNSVQDWQIIHGSLSALRDHATGIRNNIRSGVWGGRSPEEAHGTPAGAQAQPNADPLRLFH